MSDLFDQLQPIPQLLNLHGRQALVTGASGTLGEIIALRLAQAGARVAAQYHNTVPDRLLETSQADPSLQIVAVQAPLHEPQGIDTLFERLQELQFAPDVIVNNAADQSVAGYEDMPRDAWREMFATNVDAPFMIIQRALQSLSGGGAVVNISSIEGADPAPGHGHYATSKAALNMLTRSMAAEFGARDIRVNTVSPGLIRRPEIESQWPEGVARWQQQAPLGRLGNAADIADAVLFLLGPASRWISGANLVVDGGMSCMPRW